MDAWKGVNRAENGSLEQVNVWVDCGEAGMPVVVYLGQEHVLATGSR